MIISFNFARIPKIIFGIGVLEQLYESIPQYGNKILVVTGGSSLDKSKQWTKIDLNLTEKNIEYDRISIQGEPSPDVIDQYVSEFRNKKIDLVIGIGGGSVTDAGKAISAMLTKNDGIQNYLEGVGDKVHDGLKIPYIAIPTTSGTGSEATKNAVISKIGPDGFKKSLRHDNFVPDIAILDPKLMVTCPPSITAACGMDAFTQLLEAYVSSKSSPMTDALAYSGLDYMKDEMIPACGNGSQNLKVRAEMAYGALMSGICLANAGLGVVHGLASSIGGKFDIPHGVVCGSLLAEATKMNIKKLKDLGLDGIKGLKKHAMIGAMITGGDEFTDKEIIKYCAILTDALDLWTQKLGLDRLGRYGVTEDSIDELVANTGLKNNPVQLSQDDIKTIVRNRI